MGILKSFNSFDYLFAIYTLLQIVQGYNRGFRIMLFDTLKWILLAVGLYLANAMLLPVMMRMPFFLTKSKQINEWFIKAAAEFIPQKDEITQAIYFEVIQSIPYDKIVFFIIVMAVVGIVSRLIIIGTLWGEQPKGRLLGAVFGVLKSLFIAYLILSFVGAIMAVSNPQGYLAWQNESFFLSHISKRF